MSFKSSFGALEDTGGSWLGIVHPDLDLDLVRNIAWIFPEVFITLRSAKAQIQSVWNQYSLELESVQLKIIKTGSVGSGVENSDCSTLAELINS